VVGGVLPTCRLGGSWDIAASGRLQDYEKIWSPQKIEKGCDEMRRDRTGRNGRPSPCKFHSTDQIRQ